MLEKVSDFGSVLEFISFQRAICWKKNCYLVKNAGIFSSNVMATLNRDRWDLLGVI